METKGLKQIGKGSFSTVYKKDANKVLIKSCDNVKECMSMEWFPNSRLFPKIERVGVSDCGQFQFYEEKFYQKATSLKRELLPSEYEFYKFLQYHPGSRDINETIKFFKTIPEKYKSKRKALIESVEALMNYGSDIGFEISPRNVAVHNGKLILLDCFFFYSTLKMVINRKRKTGIGKIIC